MMMPCEGMYSSKGRKKTFVYYSRGVGKILSQLNLILEALGPILTFSNL